MSTPLYKRFKSKGTTFYAFPSTSQDPNPNFTKFALLRIPAKVNSKTLDFDLADLNGNTFDIYTTNVGIGTTYSEQLVESLRNYVANQDTVFRESKISDRKEFYNVNEANTPTEKIFWKWLRKFGAIDFEPAQHKIDWDKNLSDFDNPNADTVSNTDYFRKYLWKEREINDYAITTIIYQGVVSGLGSNIAQVLIEYPVKYKVGDEVIFSGSVGTQIKTGTTYSVLKVEVLSNTESYIYINEPTLNMSVTSPSATVKLNYNKVVKYIGEINVKSDVHTASKDESEIIAYIPHQAGATPTVLFDLSADTNYYPSLELPILSTEIQQEIKGAQNYTSPIRQTPSDYPGLYYGQFDTSNKTYKCSSGDKLRYSGKYYGILLNNNVGLSDEDYVEKLSEFNSNDIDGLVLDFILSHYLKFTIKDKNVGFNFDEFNQLSIDGNAPEDFEYNAILWYYESEDANGNPYNNLYGVTFLNNPENDDDSVGTFMTCYQKLVSTEEHDGVSYQHVLNLSTSVDNDTSSLAFDPLSLNNTFGFDLYQNVMSNMAKLNESFINIITSFISMNEDLNDMRSVIYSQTDINLIKNKLKNLEDLLTLYSQYQFVNSESVTITPDYSGVYPTLSFNVKSIEYKDIVILSATTINEYMNATGNDYPISVDGNNKIMVKITNDDISNYTLTRDLNIVLKNDLLYKQTVEIILDCYNASIPDKINLYMNFYDSVSGITTKIPIVDNVYLPIDLGVINPTIIYHKNKFLSRNVYQNVNLVKDVGNAETLLYTDGQCVFGNANYNEYVYVNDLYFLDSNNNIINKSGMYKVGSSSSDFNPTYIKILLNSNALTPVGVPQIHSYRTLKINITRIDNTTTSLFKDRYYVEKLFL